MFNFFRIQLTSIRLVEDNLIWLGTEIVKDFKHPEQNGSLWPIVAIKSSLCTPSTRILASSTYTFPNYFKSCICTDMPSLVFIDRGDVRYLIIAE